MSHYITSFLLCTASLLAQSDAGTVSVEELRNPLSGKSLRTILSAQQHLRAGERIQGLQELRQAMNDPIAMPYAISMLGAEHARSGEYDVARRELQEAVKLLPGKPENLSNLAYVLYLTGRTEEGVAEARKALRLDPSRPKTRLVLGLLLLQQGSHEAEAIANIQAATQEIPSAHLALAAHYERLGHAPEAERERRAYSVTSNSLLANSK